MCNFLSQSPVSIIQTCYHHHRLAPLSGAGVSSGALVQTNNKLVYADVMPTQSSFWHHLAVISSPCDQHLLGHIHTCSGREPDSSVPGARVPFASTRGKNRPAANRSRPVPVSTLRPERVQYWPNYMSLISE